MTDLCFINARELRAALGRREVSAREVVQAHLDQIERVNPDVNAVVTLVAERALDSAALDRTPEELKPSLRENTAQGRKLSGADLGRAEVLHTALFQRVRGFFTSYDILLLPVSQVLPFGVGLEYPAEIAGVPMTDYLDWMKSAYLVSLTGCPALSVPAGFSAGGLPVGVQIVGPHRADFAVLQAGHAFEQATQVARRRPPEL